MKVVLFCHSLVSDWNHGNAHFLRGVVSELLARGHEVKVFEPVDSWSRQNLIQQHGPEPVKRFHRAYPELKSIFYDLEVLNLEAAVSDADLVIVHEWNDPQLVARIGELRRLCSFVLFFHDTHHRLLTEPESMARYDLSDYDGVLAFGKVLSDLYLSRRLARRVWTWHEAADVRRFRPWPNVPKEGDLAWIGNWGDEERSAELYEFLIEPVRELGLKAVVYGVRYPEGARKALMGAGIEYRGWLPNFEVAGVFSRFRITVHIPRRPYVKALRGIPTIRPFEAMACGIPLLSAPWEDVEGLFTPEHDLVFASTGVDMKDQMRQLLVDERRRESLASHGELTIRKRHTCGHRVDELLTFYQTVRSEAYSDRTQLASIAP